MQRPARLVSKPPLQFTPADRQFIQRLDRPNLVHRLVHFVFSKRDAPDGYIVNDTDVVFRTVRLTQICYNLDISRYSVRCSRTQPYGVPTSCFSQSCSTNRVLRSVHRRLASPPCWRRRWCCNGWRCVYEPNSIPSGKSSRINRINKIKQD